MNAESAAIIKKMTNAASKTKEFYLSDYKKLGNKKIRWHRVRSYNNKTAYVEAWCARRGNHFIGGIGRFHHDIHGWIWAIIPANSMGQPSFPMFFAIHRYDAKDVLVEEHVKLLPENPWASVANIRNVWSTVQSVLGSL